MYFSIVSHQASDTLHRRYRVRCNPSQSLSQTFVQKKPPRARVETWVVFPYSGMVINPEGYMIYIYMIYVTMYNSIPVVPHKAVAEVSKIGNL
jgi:hypothetical protein